ncbi:MAG: hypothetical protein ABIO70_13425 [Pseudomonadota bacterium]
MVYSTHLFEWGAESLEDYEGYLTLWENGFSATQAAQGVPYYIGSFSTFVDEPWAYQAAGQMRALFEREGWSWTLWTFARLDDPIDQRIWGSSSSWGLLGRLPADATFERPDLYRDGQETLAAKLKAYATLDLQPNPALLEALTEGAEH